jgi:hypothetical protein
MKSWQLLTAVFAIILLSNQSSLEATPIVKVAIDGVEANVATTWDPDARGQGQGAYIIEGFSWQSSNSSGDGGRINLSGFLDPDPTLLFAGAVVDFGSPSNFSFTYILPLSPTVPNPSIVFDNMSGSVTDGGNNGVTLTALPPPAGIPTDSDGLPEIQVYTLSDDGGITWQNVGLDLGPSATFPSGAVSAVYGPFIEGPIPTIAGGPWTHMRADVNFRLSGGGDAFTFNGRKDLHTLIPEPGTFALAFFSLTAFCLYRRRPLTHSSAA